MTTWRVTYTDGTHEDITGFTIRTYDGVLTIEQGNASYNRQPRSWPLVNVRSWEPLR